MDDLRHLLGAYFYEFWDEYEYESWETAVDDFAQRSPQRAGRVPAEIDELLNTIETDELLSQETLAMGCTFSPPEGDRAWLKAVRSRLLKSVDPDSR